MNHFKQSKGLIYDHFEFTLFSCLNLYFRWHDIKDEEICDPMEKL